MAALTHQFCSVFVLKGSIYLWTQEKVGGPRRAIFPPKELDPEITEDKLGEYIFDALDKYKDSGRSLSPDDWSRLNTQLLDFFGEKSIGAFERKKKEVTVRRSVFNGEISLFGPKQGETLLRDTARAAVGRAVLKALGMGKTG